MSVFGPRFVNVDVLSSSSTGALSSGVRRSPHTHPRHLAQAQNRHAALPTRHGMQMAGRVHWIHCLSSTSCETWALSITRYSMVQRLTPKVQCNDRHVCMMAKVSAAGEKAGRKAWTANSAQHKEDKSMDTLNQMITEITFERNSCRFDMVLGAGIGPLYPTNTGSRRYARSSIEPNTQSNQLHFACY